MREHIERVSSAIAGLADLTRARLADPARAALRDERGGVQRRLVGGWR